MRGHAVSKRKGREWLRIGLGRENMPLRECYGETWKGGRGSGALFDDFAGEWADVLGWLQG